MKWIQGAALAALLVGQAAAQQPRPAEDRFRHLMEGVGVAGPDDALNPRVSALLEAATASGVLLAWRDRCQPSAGARVEVDLAQRRMNRELEEMPPLWRQFAAGALAATRLAHDSARTPCAELARAALEANLQSPGMQVPR